MLVRVLLALLLASPAGAASAPAARAIARSVALHLDNAAALKAAPLAPPAAAVDTSIPMSVGVTAGERLPLAYLQSLSDASDPGGLLLAAAATQPSAVEPAARLLHRAGAEGAAASERLMRFAKERFGWTLDYARKDERMARRLSQLFDQTPAAEPAPAVLAPGAARVKPPRALLDRWFDQPAESAAWVFQGLPREELDELLNVISAPDSFWSVASELSKPGPAPAYEERRAIERYPNSIDDFYHARRTGVEAPLGESFRTPGALVSAMLERGVTGAALRAVMNHTLAWSDGTWRIEHAPGTWRLLTPAQRDAAAAGMDLFDETGVTHDPAALGLEPLLTPFMRRTLGTFAECTGPNCFNLARSPDDDSPPAYTSGGELIVKLSDASRWTPVHDESRRAGDVLLYKDAKGRPKHAAVHLKDGWVFTKNGMQRAHPYVIQTVEQGEKTYFPGTGWILEVYRPVR